MCYIHYVPPLNIIVYLQFPGFPVAFRIKDVNKSRRHFRRNFPINDEGSLYVTKNILSEMFWLISRLNTCLDKIIGMSSVEEFKLTVLTEITKTKLYALKWMSSQLNISWHNFLRIWLQSNDCYNFRRLDDRYFGLFLEWLKSAISRFHISPASVSAAEHM